MQNSYSIYSIKPPTLNKGPSYRQEKISDQRQIRIHFE